MGEYVLGGRVFSSKTAAIKEIKRILNNSRINQPLLVEDFNLVRASLELHPHRAEKLAHGCASIETRINKIPDYPAARGFWIIGDNGVETSFSYTAPFKETESRSDLMWAARHAIKGFRDDFKNAVFGDEKLVRCPISGKMITYEEAHVDHEDPTFVEIYDAWIAARGGIKPRLIRKDLIHVLEPDVEREFAEFHNARAKLRVVDFHENLKRKRKE